MQSSGDTLRVGDHCPTTGQGLQAAADPGADLKVPVGQGEHGPPVGPKKPVVQVQLAREELPAVEKELGGQAMQVLEKKTFSPVVVEKKPGPHRPWMHVELEMAPVVLLEDNTKVLHVVERLYTGLKTALKFPLAHKHTHAHTHKQ